MGWIFQEATRGKIQKESRLKLVNALYTFTSHRFNNDPSTDDVINICKATINLLPCLKTEPSDVDGIVSDFFYNLSLIRNAH